MIFVPTTPLRLNRRRPSSSSSKGRYRLLQETQRLLNEPGKTPTLPPPFVTFDFFIRDWPLFISVVLVLNGGSILVLNGLLFPPKSVLFSIDCLESWISKVFVGLS
ncbi:unnamed protein product [Ilex paraguariensis]|uniref:Uncharacterized protein n=1 Tax=Ilex paraguariensis TaxID=185542 RepID=A0ABC8R3B5_9AQUA